MSYLVSRFGLGFVVVMGDEEVPRHVRRLRGERVEHRDVVNQPADQFAGLEHQHAVPGGGKPHGERARRPHPTRR